MKVSSTKNVLSIFCLLFLFLFSIQNSYGFVKPAGAKTFVEDNKTNVSKNEAKIDKKQERKIKRLEKKLNKYEQKEQAGKGGLGLLISGGIFFLLGFVLIVAGIGGGLTGLLSFLIGVPLLIAGIVLLLVYLFK